MKYLTHTGLEPLALALIFIPDPITTVVGIGLLSHIMHIKQRGNLEYHRSMHFRNNHYSYKIDMIDNTTITFQLSAARQGQLPVDWPQISGIYHTPQLWSEFHNGKNRKAVAGSLPPSDLKPAGLLGKLRSRHDAKFFAPRLLPTQ